MVVTTPGRTRPKMTEWGHGKAPTTIGEHECRVRKHLGQENSILWHTALDLLGQGKTGRMGARIKHPRAEWMRMPPPGPLVSVPIRCDGPVGRYASS